MRTLMNLWQGFLLAATVPDDATFPDAATVPDASPSGIKKGGNL